MIPEKTSRNRLIYQDYLDGKPVTAIAKQYGISQKSCWAICRRWLLRSMKDRI